MQLSAPEFERLMGSLAPASASPDNRREKRLPISASAMVLPLGDEAGVRRVRVIDLSPQGICVLHRASVSVGSEFLIRLPQEGDGVATFIRCLVRSCIAVGDGLFRIGAEFFEVDSRGPCLLGIPARDFD